MISPAYAYFSSENTLQEWEVVDSIKGPGSMFVADCRRAFDMSAGHTRYCRPLISMRCKRDPLEDVSQDSDNGDKRP
jgi:hypothetical protein